MRSDGKFPKLEAPPTGTVLVWTDVLGVVLWPLKEGPSEDALDLMAEILILDEGTEMQLRAGDTWSINARQLLGSSRIE